MFKPIFFLILLFLFTYSFADSVVQTDWSTGPGVTGIQSDWESSFSNCISSDWFTSDGLLGLGAVRIDSLFTITTEPGFGPFCVVDYDFDGDKDILSINTINQTIHWFENVDGNGVNWVDHHLTEFSSGTFDFTAITAADFDNNNQIDIALGTEVELVVYYGSGSEFYPVYVGSYGIVYDLLCNDVDNDGDKDLCMISEHSWYGLGSYVYNKYPLYDWDFFEIEYIASDYYLADIDGDGDKDVPAARYWAGGVKWYGDNSGCIITEGSGAWSIASGDFDIDGDNDVVVDYCSFLLWYENIDGAGTEWVEKEFKNNSKTLYYPQIEADDFDFDGDADVVRRASGVLQISWNEDYQGSSWSFLNSDISATGSGDVYSTDINQDGINDIVASWSSTGSLFWWQAGKKALSGELTSSILMLPSDPQWSSITWECSQPSGTNISFLVRSSDDPSVMGEWSDAITVSGTSLSSYLSDYDNYLQYKVILNSDNILFSPELYEVEFNYNSLGIENSESIMYSAEMVSNPTSSSPHIRFELSEPAPIEISLYDISGRLIHRETQSFTTGNHEVELKTDKLDNGLYFCLLTLQNQSVSLRFVSVD